VIERGSENNGILSLLTVSSPCDALPVVGYLSPTVALNSCEQALRVLFAHAYRSAYGDDWLTRVASDDQIGSWRNRRDTEGRARHGVAGVDQSELAYAEFYELCNIAEKNWDRLADALGKKKNTLPLLRRFEALRNTVAHSRSVLQFEEDLLSGIAGEIRNRVTIYMSAQDPTGDYFARIEAVADSFGNAVVPDVSSWALTIDSGITLRVGDTVHFTCRATDPQDRPIRWVLSCGSRETEAAGSEAVLEWIVSDEDVSQLSIAEIRMLTESQHHRWGFHDGRALFSYRVLPPLVERP
jgi:hypothetical protein